MARNNLNSLSLSLSLSLPPSLSVSVSVSVSLCLSLSLSLILSLSLSYRLEEIIHQDSKLYLVFEFMSMDLKKYLDTIPSGQYIDPVLLKVMITVIMDT